MLRQKLATIGLVLLASAMLHPQSMFADDSGPSHLRNETLVVARIGDSNSFAAYSKHSGTKYKCQARKLYQARKL